MVNLRGVANSVTRAINPNVPAFVLRNENYATRADGARLPKYSASRVVLQVQALSYGDLRQLEGLNIQGVKRAIYVNGAVAGVIRVGQKGGDIIRFAPGNPGVPYEGTTWLCVHVLEQWPDWCKFAVTLQDEIDIKHCACD